MTAFSDIGGRARRGARHRDADPPRAREIAFAFEGVESPPATELLFPASERRSADDGSSGSLAAGFDMAAIRPGATARPDASEAKRPAAWSRGAVFSGGAHLAAIAFVLAWGTPAGDPPPPEPVTIEIVADAPTPPVSAPPVSAASPLPVPPPPDPARADPEPPPSATAAIEPPPSPAPSASPPPPVETPPADAPPRLAPVTRTPAPRVLKPPPTIQKPRQTLRGPREEAAPAAASKPTRIAVASPRAAAPSVSGADAVAYQGEVLGRIAAQKRYPEAARDRAPHGVAVVRFSIDAAGQLAGASLAQSAGDALLDAEALATVRRASPFPPPPAGAPRSFSAPLSYRVR